MAQICWRAAGYPALSMPIKEENWLPGEKPHSRLHAIKVRRMGNNKEMVFASLYSFSLPDLLSQRTSGFAPSGSSRIPWMSCLSQHWMWGAVSDDMVQVFACHATDKTVTSNPWDPHIGQEALEADLASTGLREHQGVSFGSSMRIKAGNQAMEKGKKPRYTGTLIDPVQSRLGYLPLPVREQARIYYDIEVVPDFPNTIHITRNSGTQKTWARFEKFDTFQLSLGADPRVLKAKTVKAQEEPSLVSERLSAIKSQLRRWWLFVGLGFFFTKILREASHFDGSLQKCCPDQACTEKWMKTVHQAIAHFIRIMALWVKNKTCKRKLTKLADTVAWLANASNFRAVLGGLADVLVSGEPALKESTTMNDNSSFNTINFEQDEMPEPPVAIKASDDLDSPAQGSAQNFIEQLMPS
ncbi:hypothetical protein J3R30DRAFT_3409686 [Lentinula aciculospora]|uniref:Uncharacterized protein n=1 Tax=Lentinula aciculospora TaxID=153920 RepID=A0A9W8ZXN0_9AGAR|nr:hypothetical protein J3R30DRAFT_3409686 [Lentinula aciculospora]